MNVSQTRDTISMFYGPPMGVISDCLRGFLVAAPGRRLISCDFSNVEGRKLAWLAGEEWKLQAFRDFDLGVGPDIYKLAYSVSFHVPVELVTDPQRQVGKVEELALGFGGGVGAFQQMARGYNVKMSDAEAERVKQGWRAAHPRICAYWYELEGAAVAAVKNPGQVCVAGPLGRQIKYLMKGSFLFCQLPSKRAITYPYPKIWQQVWGKFKSATDGKMISRTFHGETGSQAEAAAHKYAAAHPGMELLEVSSPSDLLSYMGEENHQWTRQKAYGGLLAENVTQASSRDLLREAMFAAEKHGYEVIFHAHDEINCDVPNGFGSAKELEAIMSVVPSWAEELPLTAKGWEGFRYRK